MKRAFLMLAAVLALACGCAAPARSAPTVCEASWTDAGRDRRIPLRIRMPEGSGRVPLILFSHGLGGSLDSGTIWAEAWAEAGFAVINLQHPGSDSGILESENVRREFVRAMAPDRLAARARDVSFVIDSLAERRSEGACNLDRIDLSRIGMSGHSYGAHTTQAIAGQTFPLESMRGLADPRVRAAIAFSPSPPFRRPSEEAFGEVRIPFFSVTGSEDSVPFLPQITPADRERPFRAMPPGGKYLLVLNGARHNVFNAQPNLRRRQSARDPRVEAIVTQATTDFWRWTLAGDIEAKRRLDTLAERLGVGDRFERR